MSRRKLTEDEIFRYQDKPYKYYEIARKILLPKYNYACQNPSCVSKYQTKVLVTYGCVLLDSYYTERNLNRHPDFCPNKANMETFRLGEKVCPKMPCIQCEYFGIFCYEVPRTSRLVMHHINGNAKDNNRRNLTILCKSCNHILDNQKPSIDADKIDDIFVEKNKKLEETEMFGNNKSLEEKIEALEKRVEATEKRADANAKRADENELKLMEVRAEIHRMEQAWRNMKFAIVPMQQQVCETSQVPQSVPVKKKTATKGKHPLRIKERLKRKAIDNEATKMQRQYTQYHDPIDEITITAMKQQVKAKQKKIMSINEIDEMFYPILVENDLPRTLVNCYKNWLVFDKFFKKSGRNTYEILS